MKRFLCMLLAVLAAAFAILSAGCAERVTEVDIPGASQAPEKAGHETVSRPTDVPGPKQADGTGYDNSVRFTDGELVGSEYHWNFFLNKVSVGFPGEVTVVVKEGESTFAYDISYSKGEFIFNDEEDIIHFAHLAQFKANVPAGRVSLAVLTNIEGLTAEEFFGGEAPADLKIGFTNEKGIVIYAKFE